MSMIDIGIKIFKVDKINHTINNKRMVKMKQKRLAKFFSLITYKEQKKPKDFYIPEVNESTQDTQSPPPLKEKPERTIKKATLVSEMNKDERFKRKQSDSNAISTDIASNLNMIKKEFNVPDNKDFAIREIVIGGKAKAFIAFMDGMVDRPTINTSILRPLLDQNKFTAVEEGGLIDFIVNNVLEIHQLKKIATTNEATTEILIGNTIICVDGYDTYITCETKGYEKRNVEKPVIESVVKGSQEAFNENMRTNITLIRRIIKSKDLISEFFKLGERTNNQCAIMYIKGIVNPALVKEVKRRLGGIKTDYIQGDGVLEQFIEDSPNAIISTMISTERPDRVASFIIEGKVAIISEGVPFVLVVPATILSLLHTSEETTLRWQYGTFIRLVRLFAIFVAAMLPGLYVALTTFHREMIPTDLLIAIGQARENVPFPTLVEVLLMEAAFELIREAGIRIPGIVGNTIGIIGALILGQAAVQANLVSPILIIIVAFTGLGNFAIPDYSLAYGIRVTRIAFIVAGAILGFVGIYILMICFSAIIVNIKSFGVPLLSAYGPKTRKSNDAIIRKPWWQQELRPDYLNVLNVRRQPGISRQWAKEDADVSTPGKSEDQND